MNRMGLDNIITSACGKGNLVASGSIFTGFVDCASYALLAFNLKATVASTIKIHQCYSANDAVLKTLVYQQDLTASEYFYKPLTIKAPFFQIELVNTTASAGRYMFQTRGLTNPNFEAQTFLNSPIDINTNTSLNRIGNDFRLDLIRGVHPSFSKVNVLGLTDQHSTETIGLNSASYFPASAETLYATSSSADDDETGTGARTVLMEYINASGEEATYTITLQGTTILNLGFTALAVNTLKVQTTGSTNNNVGTISVYTDNTPANIVCRVLPNNNISRVAQYRVPSAKTLVVGDLNISGYSVGTTLEIVERVGTINYKIGSFKINTANQQLEYKLDTKVNGGSTIYVRQIPIATTGATTLINININSMLCPAINNF